MGCACKKTKISSQQPKQINKSGNKSISPRTTQRSTSVKRVIRRRPI